MSRQRKTWVSDSYALRQAAFMQLPPAKVVCPFRGTLTRLLDLLPKNPSMEQVGRWQALVRPLVRAAKHGDGGEVRRLAATLA